MTGTKSFRGDRLRQLREARRISQDDLAAVLQLGESQVTKWENNRNDPSAEMLVKLAQFFEVTVDYLLGLSDSPLGVITESDLSADEKRLLDAFRRRNIEVIQIVSERLVNNH